MFSKYLLSDTFLDLQFLHWKKKKCEVVIVNILLLTCQVMCTVSSFIKIVKQSYPGFMHAEILKSCAMKSIFKEFRSKKSYKWHEMSIFQTELNKGNL